MRPSGITRDLDSFLKTALTLADIAAEMSADAWRSDLAVGYKDDGSSLTQADLAIEAGWRDMIRRAHPSHGILGEEYGAETGDSTYSSAYTWVLDPIDGTRQFGAGLLNHASLIGLCRDGRPVLGVIDLPVPGARYVAVEGGGTVFAERRVRTSGRTELPAAVVGLANPNSFSAKSVPAYEAMRSQGRTHVFDGGAPAYGALSRGLIDVCLNGDDLDPYDICALCPVVTEAGGTITDWAGRELFLESSGAIVASASDALHAVVLETLARAT